MRRFGEVTGIDGEYLQITFCRPADCGKCHACDGGRAKAVLRLKGTAEIGDCAVVDMPTDAVMKSSLIAYVMPLCGLLGGTILGYTIGKTDMAGLIGGVIGLVITGAILFVTEKKRRANPAWQPKLQQIIPKAEAAEIKKEEE